MLHRLSGAAGNKLIPRVPLPSRCGALGWRFDLRAGQCRSIFCACDTNPGGVEAANVSGSIGTDNRMSSDSEEFPMISFRQIQLKAGDVYAGIGSRDTPDEIQREMTAIAAALEKLGLILGSGGADAADLAFERGVVDPAMKHIFLPWQGFNESNSPHYPRDREIDRKAHHLASLHHPGWDVMLAKANATGRDEKTVRAARKARASMKLHARNGYQVLGDDLNTPVPFVLCWTADGGPTGGTGQAIRIAEDRGIPVFNLFFPEDRADVMARLGIVPG